MDRETFTYLEACYRPLQNIEGPSQIASRMSLADNWMQTRPNPQRFQQIWEEIRNKVVSVSSGGLLSSPPAIAFEQQGLRAFVDWTAERAEKWNTTQEEQAVASFLASALYEFAPYILPVNTNGDFRLRIEREIASYAGWRNLLSFMNETASRESGYRNEFDVRTREVIDSARDIVSRITSDANHAALALNEFETKSAETLIERMEEIQRFKESRDNMDLTVASGQAKITDMAATAVEVEDRARAAIESLLADAANKSGRTFWKQRAGSSRRMLWFTGITLALLMLGLPGYAIANMDGLIHAIARINVALLDGLPENPSATQYTILAVNRLLIFATPLIIYFWLMRILVRLAMHSVASAEDADQRHTIIDTFVHLLGKDVAKPEDRGAMFAAVFRPPVSLTGDVSEPPTLMNTVIEKIRP